MKELKCPKCSSVFTVDEADYASIVNQVKSVEFQNEVDRRLEEIDKQYQAELKAGNLKAEQTYIEKLSAKEIELGKRDTEIAKLNEQLTSIAQAKQLDFNAALAKKEQEITRLTEQLTSAVQAKQIDFNAELAKKDQEITKLTEQISNILQNKQLEMATELAKKEQEITGLRSAISHKEKESQIAVLEERSKVQAVVQNKEKEIIELKNQVDSEKTAAALRVNSISEQHKLEV